MLNKSINVIGRRHPVKRTHRKVIVFSAVNSKLLFKVVKRIKSVSGIKIFVIFTVATLDLAVVPRAWALRKFLCKRESKQIRK